MQTLLHEFRYALRQLWKSPGFTPVAVLTLALGIGANTAIFSVVNAVLLRALPYPNADRLLLLWSSAPSQGLPMFGSSPVDYRAWRSDNHSFEDMGAFSNGGISMSLEGPSSRAADLFGRSRPTVSDHGRAALSRPRFHRAQRAVGRASGCDSQLRTYGSAASAAIPTWLDGRCTWAASSTPSPASCPRIFASSSGRS